MATLCLRSPVVMTWPVQPVFVCSCLSVSVFVAACLWLVRTDFPICVTDCAWRLSDVYSCFVTTNRSVSLGYKWTCVVFIPRFLHYLVQIARVETNFTCSFSVPNYAAKPSSICSFSQNLWHWLSLLSCHLQCERRILAICSLCIGG